MKRIPTWMETTGKRHVSIMSGVVNHRDVSHSKLSGMREINSAITSQCLQSRSNFIFNYYFSPFLSFFPESTKLPSSLKPIKSFQHNYNDIS